VTRLLLGYDGSSPARAAIAAAAALWPDADATVVTVPPPAPDVAWSPVPADPVLDELQRIGDEHEERARATATEGAELARAAGLVAQPLVHAGSSPWRALQEAASRARADVLVCGTRGEGALARSLLGSTASSLLHHADRALLVVPAGEASLDGPLLAGYDGSEGSREALRFAAAHLRDRPVFVAHAWRSPVRHSLRGHALLASHVDTMEDYAETVDTIWREVAEETSAEGTAYARELGLGASAVAPESGRGDWHALLREARRRGAAALLVGSRGRGAVAATVLGSVTSGLVHAASLPVLVVQGPCSAGPEGRAGASGAR
jgi:nucleotide-binding universal stress UspA family protein